MNLQFAGHLFLGAALWASSFVPVAAQQEGPRFKPPVRLKAGGSYLGAKRLYPSPVIEDVDGDGRRDVVIGDLFGKLTFGPCEAGDEGATTFGSERPVEDSTGAGIRFHNW